MVFKYLLVVSRHSTTGAFTSTPSQKQNKNPNLIWQLHVLFSLLDAVCLLSLWFSFCSRFFGAYWHLLSVETVCKLFKMFTAN